MGRSFVNREGRQIEVVELSERRPPGDDPRRRKHFALVPFVWVERLVGASGLCHQIAWRLLYESWRHNGAPFKLGNDKLRRDGINHTSKRRALAELERRGLIEIERRKRGSSPIIRLLR